MQKLLLLQQELNEVIDSETVSLNVAKWSGGYNSVLIAKVVPNLYNVKISMYLSFLHVVLLHFENYT